MDLSFAKGHLSTNLVKLISHMCTTQSWITIRFRIVFFTWAMIWFESFPAKTIWVVGRIDLILKPLSHKLKWCKTVAWRIDSTQIKLSRTQAWWGEFTLTRLCPIFCVFSNFFACCCPVRCLLINIWLIKMKNSYLLPYPKWHCFAGYLRISNFMVARNSPNKCEKIPKEPAERLPGFFFLLETINRGPEIIDINLTWDDWLKIDASLRCTFLSGIESKSAGSQLCGTPSIFLLNPTT